MAYVYRFKHRKTREIIYVGKTKRPIESRINEHFSSKGHLPSECYNSVGRVEYIPLKTEADALFVENYFINKYKPLYNVKDKVESTLTYNLNIKHDWQLLCIMNDEIDDKSLSDKIIEIIFWSLFAYFFILAVIGIYF